MKLYAGPWTGEFGWAIMTWQAHLRAIAPKYDEVIICCPPNHSALYEDFAISCIEYDSTTVKANMWHNEAHDDVAMKYFHRVANSQNGDRWLSPADVWQPYLRLPKWDQLIAVQPQKYIEFGERHDVGYAVLIHARKRDDWDSGFRNWDREHCQKVMKALPSATIACIGTEKHALHIEGTVDLRDIPLDVLFDYMRSSKVLVGPISGPTHLATLCGLPQVTWATKREHKDRVEKKWNPFDTPTSVFVADDRVWRERINWHPEVDEVVKEVERYL